MHAYRVTASWSGATGRGYEDYDRSHAVTVPAAGAALTLSSDPAFRGDAGLLNPEQLLLLAASSCQLLSFLAVAARARIDVRAYDDDASAVMPEDDRPMRVTAITLRPRVTVVTGPSDSRVRHLLEVAHRECFIANSLTSTMTIEPEVIFVDP